MVFLIDLVGATSTYIDGAQGKQKFLQQTHANTHTHTHTHTEGYDISSCRIDPADDCGFPVVRHRVYTVCTKRDRLRLEWLRASSM